MNSNAFFFLPHQPQMLDFHRVGQKVYGANYTEDNINQQYLSTCLLIYQEAEPVARLCLYYNPDIGDSKTLLFGNMEFINDVDVFEQLIAEAEKYALQNDYNAILGPINGSTWDEYRLPLTNEGRQFITDLQQPLYYGSFLIQTGYEVIQRYYTQSSKLICQSIDKVTGQKFQDQGIIIRAIDLTNYEIELEKLYPFCINVFANNVYYSPIDKLDFTEKYNRLQQFLNPEFVLIAENKQLEIVAFLLCLPDAYHSDTIVMKTMARNSDAQLKGLMTYIIDIFYNRAVAAGYNQLLHAFFHEKNRSGILSEKYNGQPFKSYALFQKKLVN